MDVLTVKPRASRVQDMLQMLQSVFSGFVMLIASSGLQSQFHVGRTAHFSTAAYTAACLQLSRCKDKKIIL